MNAKSVTILVVTAAIVAMAWKISTDRAPQEEVSRSVLKPEFLERLNEATRLSLRSAEKETTLVRSGESWLIENKDNFRAKPGDVRRTLLQLAGLRAVEAKTRNAERYPSLGVADLDVEGADGTLVEVASQDDSVLAGLIVGHARDGSPRPQHYVRTPGDEQSWLVEGALDVPADPIRWLDAQITDIASERVREVSVTAPAETPIVIRKAEADDSFFELQDVPEGYEPKSKATISSLGALLLDLRFNDVAGADRISGLTAVRRIEVRTFDGLLATIDEFALNDDAYMRFEFVFDDAGGTTDEGKSEDGAGEPDLSSDETVAEVPDKSVDEGDIDASAPSESVADEATPAESVTDEATSAESVDREADAAESVADEARRLNERTSDWIYVLPKYKRRLFDRDFESLVKEPEADS